MTRPQGWLALILALAIGSLLVLRSLPLSLGLDLRGGSQLTEIQPIVTHFRADGRMRWAAGCQVRGMAPRRQKRERARGGGLSDFEKDLHLLVAIFDFTMVIPT